MKIDKKKRLLEELKNIEDFRKDKYKIEYPLYEVLFMAIFGLLKGYTTYDELYHWMEYQVDNSLLKKLFGKTEINIPSRSTLHHLLMNTDNNEIEKVFRNHFFPYVKMEEISVDGKWLRGSDINGQYTKESHKSIFNIFDKEKKIVIAHKFLGKNKLSEITAFKELLDDECFSKEGQIFSFDALSTQVKILNKINDSNQKYIAKVKGNQKKLKAKLQETIKIFDKPSQTYKSTDCKEEGNKLVKRTVEVFENSDCNIVMFHSNFNNIQTIVKITKEIFDPKTRKTKIVEGLFIANFKSDAESFLNSILSHWGVETYHYHLDTLTNEDDHIAYVNPYSISILRSFVINLYQLYFNKNKGEKIKRVKVTMANIKKSCHHSDDFASEIFEIEA